MTKYKYELVTDLTIIEIAKAMIDGEVFYSQLGENKYYWIGGEFRSENVRGSSDIMKNWLTYCFYRKVECDWTDNLDGTAENGVLCWVSNVYADLRNTMALIKDDGLYYIDMNGEEWTHTTPLTKEEIQAFLNNAPTQE